METKLEKDSITSEEELDQLFKKCYSNCAIGNPIDVKGFILPETYTNFAKIYNEFQIFDSDVLICGFPRSGTNWISEIAWLILHDLDYEGAKMSYSKRWSNLDLCFLYGNSSLAVDRYGSAFAEKIYRNCNPQSNPSVIKTHLPFPLLPEDIRNGRGKVIYIARNPMDVCISYYHHFVNFLNGYSGTLDDSCKLFLYGKSYYGPHAKHVLSFWEERNKPNILFITYEEMQQDLPKALRMVAQFLGKKLSEDDCSKLQEYVTFDSMKRNPAVNREDLIKKMMEEEGRKIISPFIRKGKVEGYKTEMPPNYISLFQYWMPKQFEGSGLKLWDF